MSKGITLIETIIGLAILSFGALAIMASFSVGLNSLLQNQETNTALFLASSRIEELSAKRYEDIRLGIDEYFFETAEGYEDYKVRTEVDCFEMNGQECSEDGIKEITVTVFSEGGHGHEVTLTTLTTKK